MNQQQRNERESARRQSCLDLDEEDEEEAQWAEWSSLSEEQLYRRLAERAARRANKSAVTSTAKQPSNSKC